MVFLKKYILHSPLKYVSSMLLALVILAVVLLSNGFDKIVFYYEGIGTAGLTLVLFAGLLLCINCGVFDSFAYSGKIVSGKIQPGKEGYIDYLENKQKCRVNKRKDSIPFFLVGLLNLFTALILKFFM